jgi:hypothetical protein
VLCSEDEVLADYAKAAPPGELVASISLGAAREAVPARDRERVRGFGQAMVRATGEHIMGSDILIDAHGELWALECNTLAGFDPHSDIAQRWVAWLDGHLLNRTRLPGLATEDASYRWYTRH